MENITFAIETFQEVHKSIVFDSSNSITQLFTKT